MTGHVAYAHCAYPTAVACVEGIREHVDRGWTVVSLRGPRLGPFAAVFRKEEINEQRPAGR
jgi:hypothetical protein